MSNHLGQHAIVIGGSMTGLMTARVLADHFNQVTLLERDSIDEFTTIHKSIPQGNHAHGLLLGGLQALSSLYPDLTERLEKLGAVSLCMGKDAAFYLPDGKAYSPSGAVRAPHDLGLNFYCQSRGLLERCVRQCTLELSNVKLECNCSVQALKHEDGAVRGVRYKRLDETAYLDADLVVNAGGRGSLMPRWLAELGFQAPDETLIGIDLGYTSTKFKIPSYYDEPERAMSFWVPSPEYPNGAAMFEIEDNTWHLSMFGRFGHHPPTDEEGFLAFAKSLHTPKLYELIKDAERIADIAHHRFPGSLQRHYERLSSFPERLLVLGDAICSVNPIYAQGMSSAALQVKALQQLLQKRADESPALDGLAVDFFSKAAEIIATPWDLAANLDLMFPQTQGAHPSGLEERTLYFAAADALTAQDLEVYKLVTEVLHLTKPMSLLYEEPLRSRILKQQAGS